VRCLPVLFVDGVRRAGPGGLPRPIVTGVPVVVDEMVGEHAVQQRPVEVGGGGDGFLTQAEQHDRSWQSIAVGPVWVRSPRVGGQTFLQFDRHQVLG